MIAECPRCGGAIPMDVDTDAHTRTRLERGECPRCRFVATTATTGATTSSSSTAGSSSSERRAVTDGGRELELDREVSDR